MPSSGPQQSKPSSGYGNGRNRWRLKLRKGPRIRAVRFRSHVDVAGFPWVASPVADRSGNYSESGTSLPMSQRCRHDIRGAAGMDVTGKNLRVALLDKERDGTTKCSQLERDNLTVSYAIRGAHRGGLSIGPLTEDETLSL